MGGGGNFPACGSSGAVPASTCRGKRGMMDVIDNYMDEGKGSGGGGHLRAKPSVANSHA